MVYACTQSGHWKTRTDTIEQGEAQTLLLTRQAKFELRAMPSLFVISV